MCAHVGSLPQRSALTGGYSSSGRTAETAKRVVRDAMACEEAGASMLLVEAIPSEVTEQVLEKTRVPVIGIGGITADAAESVYVSGAAGCAVISALANATEMRAAVAAFLAPWVAAEGGSDG